MTDLTVTSYRDPITREQRVAYLCEPHETNALRVLRYAGVGSGSTLAPGLASCTACENERGFRRAKERQ